MSMRLRPPRGPGQAPHAWFVAIVIAGSAALGGVVFSRQHTALPEHSISERPIQVPTDGYSSSQACKGCHPSQYATWHGSFHRTMTQVADASSVRASFDDVRVTDVQGNPMRLSRKGDEFSAE